MPQPFDRNASTYFQETIGRKEVSVVTDVGQNCSLEWNQIMPFLVRVCHFPLHFLRFFHLTCKLLGAEVTQICVIDPNEN